MMKNPMDYKEIFKNLSPRTKLFTHIVDDFIEDRNEKHYCMFCERYNNSNALGTVVHILTTHKEILCLIQKAR